MIFNWILLKFFVNKHVLRYLLDNHYEITEQITRRCSEDYYEVIRYLHEHQYPINQSCVIELIADQSLYMIEKKKTHTLIVQKMFGRITMDRPNWVSISGE